VGGELFGEDNSKGLLSGCYFHAGRPFAGSVCSLRVHRTYDHLRLSTFRIRGLP